MDRFHLAKRFYTGGLAEGYLGTSELTEKKFVNNWFVDPKIWQREYVTNNDSGANIQPWQHSSAHETVCIGAVILVVTHQMVTWSVLDEQTIKSRYEVSELSLVRSIHISHSIL